MSFTGINAEICRRAFTMVGASIADSADMDILSKSAGTLVVVSPHLRPVTGSLEEFNQAVLFTACVNEGHPDREKYDEIAWSKAYISWLYGITSSQVQTDHPYLYQEGMTKYGGSTVLPGRLVIAFSGVQACFDEMISEWMGSAIKGLCRHEMTRDHGVMKSGDPFLRSTIEARVD